MTSLAKGLVDRWREAGVLLETPNGRVFLRDVGPTRQESAPPLLILHGFPTSSFDFRHVLDTLATNRRVVIFDQLGFGLSDKPDRKYGIHLHADTAQYVVEALALTEVDLLTHDMGDSVGGELLARSAEGSISITIRSRVVTNGSIYLDRAHLTTGQQLLSAAPDELTDPIPPEMFAAGVAATFSEDRQPSAVELEAIGLLGEHNGGLRLMARLIRYLEDRRREERRYTGAIESHPSPLGVIWGDLDPVADVVMASMLVQARPDASLRLLAGVGHYPMVEAPSEFSDAVLSFLN